ncbi:putative soluble lytic transglycosylase fused to an ABC-type amino acid-binding protein [Beggiatoa alba B18LD]|uniref:Membrane-bound lytic murein transglycosylase F n=1 Tax=Beggiatoa alba B18LD TaxID=395493 RepID=I3CCY8_9GAMM|nr:membrane-bound lytic murein transglycosylase MltF [Beggiatoa alba]EIJ41481.1 putative soluble lytic transglycosylase fused to an ABC-type amino acid-binding protein [Beggiatoa alba B18LD]
MKILTIILMGFVVTFCSPEQTLLETIKAQGELVVVTRAGPTTYYIGLEGEALGLEYELTQRFASQLGVNLKLIVATHYADILPMVVKQQVHFAAAGLTVNRERRELVRFSPAYQKTTHQLVYRKSMPNIPRSLADLNETTPLVLINGSSQVDLCKRLQQEYPQLTWQTVDLSPMEVLEKINTEEIKFALLHTNEIMQMQRFFPELQVSFEVADDELVAWAFPRTIGDDSLYVEAMRFLNQLRTSGELDRLIDRYYGHIDFAEFDYVDTRTFYRHVQERLPFYRKHFEQVGLLYNLDWRLLAAMGYQESHWNPDAVSYTGVRGIMMLTHATALELNIQDREDSIQSIDGAARYFLMLRDKLNENIPEPDKTFFTLAAYNVGLGHLYDAQQLARQQGLDPYRWVEVKKMLPLLSDPKWYRRTRHGYARGSEPVYFVNNVRRFYDKLLASLDVPVDADKQEIRIFSPQQQPTQYLSKPSQLPVL